MNSPFVMEITKKIAKELGIDQKYVKELIQIDGVMGLDEREGEGVIVQVAEEYSSKGILRLRVVGNDPEVTDMIMKEIIQETNRLYEKFISDVKGHNIRLIRQSTSEKVDMELSTLQQDVRNNMANMHRQLLEEEKNLEGLTVPEETGDSSTQTSVIKNILLGFLLGLFLAILCVCARYVMSDKVTSAKEIVARSGLKSLGTFAEVMPKRPFDFVDRWLHRIAGENANSSKSGTLEMIATNINNYADGREKLFITGFASQRLIDQVSDYLSSALPDKQFIAERDMIENASARKKLAECEAVILIEEKKISKYSLIQQEMELAENVGKEIVGVVVG